MLSTPVSLLQTLQTPFLYLFSPSQRIYWVYLLSALLIGYGVFIIQRVKANQFKTLTLREYLKFLCSSSIYGHRSSRNDVWFFIINTLLQTVCLIGWFYWVQPIMALQVEHTLFTIAPQLANTVHVPAFLGMILYTVLLFIVIDFSIYIVHWAQHFCPLLWCFHQTHHSAEVLQPLTVYRMHPVDNIFYFGVGSLALGLASGTVHYLWNTPVIPWQAAGMNIITYLFYILGYNLRHSHVWLDYGPHISRWFISPAQHQIHHSAAPQHLNKNMGFVLAIWDRIFGTLHLPTEDDSNSIQYGLGTDHQHQYGSVWSLFVQPFIDTKQLITQAIQHPKTERRLWASSLTVLMVLVIIISSVAYTHQHQQTSLRQPPPHVYLENLTWPEVQQALHSGTTSVIIPTGGTEQNGPHMVLGKHNQIIRYTAGRIAQMAGKTLVAPVMAYVPEGDISPPTQHMRFSGTLSLPANLFEQVLTETAKSLKAHGFTHIYFIGDSGWNQAPQERVAKTLQQEWGNAVTITSVAPYYFSGGREWLIERGYSPKQIGTHAGLRDTSELMAIHPEGIRTDKLNPQGTIEATGSDGMPSMATVDLGRYLIEQKIQRAAQFIKSHS